VRGWRLLSGGLTPIILLASVAAAGAWALRVSVVKRTAAEKQAERRAVATVKASKGEFEVVVNVLGKLAAVNSQQVVAEVYGQVVRLAANGIEVKKDDVIAELDMPRMLRQVREQERNYQQALDDVENKKRDLAAEVERARITLDKANQDLEQYRAQQAVELGEKQRQKEKDTAELSLSRQRFDRQSSLADEGLVPKQEVELATAQLKSKEFQLERETKALELAEAQKSSGELDKQAAVTTAEADLARAESKQEFELKNAQTELQIRKSQLDRVQEEFGKSTIRAPAAGILVLEEQWQGRGMRRRPIQPGDQVWEGRGIASIPDLSKMRVEIELPQEQARMVKRKQKVVITSEALPGPRFEGEVEEVSQTASEASIAGTGIPSAERKFQAKVAIKDLKGARLRPGMTAHAKIIIEKLPKAVSVPLECVFERDDRHIVYVRSGDTFKPVEVELGQQNDNAVVIKKGLKGDEEVALRDVGKDSAPTEAGGPAALGSGPSAAPAPPGGAGR